MLKRWWNNLQHETQAGFITFFIFLGIALFCAFPSFFLGIIATVMFIGFVVYTYHLILMELKGK